MSTQRIKALVEAKHPRAQCAQVNRSLYVVTVPYGDGKCAGYIARSEYEAWRKASKDLLGGKK